MIGLIAAVSPEGVIGVNNGLPWHHPGDLKRFMQVTSGTTVAMGRLTFESIQSKPLPRRRNIVITRTPIAGVECVASVDEAARVGGNTLWFVGGARIFADAMRLADIIDLTYVPDHVDAAGAVRFPPIDESVFVPGPLLVHENEPELRRRIFTKRR